MSTFVFIVIIVLCVNAISFTLYITDCNKYMTVSGNANKSAEPKVYLICGLGAKIVRYSSIDSKRAILVNPCINSGVLKPNLKRLIRLGWPVLASLELLLGWLSLLPLVPINRGVWQSPTSVVDQLYWIGYDPGVLRYYEPCRASELKTNFVLSDDDEFIDNTQLHIFPAAYFVEISSKHARLGEPTEASKYQSAIDHFLEAIPS